MRDLLIVGVDPGTTTAYAILDLDGNLLKLKSSKQLSLSTLITEVTNEGKVLAVGCDVSNIPSFVYKFATKLNAIIVKPDFDYKVGLKQRMTKEFKVRDDHQRDALAAALNAFKEFKETFDKIDKELKDLGKEHLNSQVKEICIKNKLNVTDAINLLETPEIKQEKKKIKKQVLNYNKANDLIRIIKKQNKELQRKLSFMQFKYQNTLKLIDKKVEERIKKSQIISELNSKSFREELLKKEIEIKNLKEKINKLNNTLLNSNEKIIAQKFKNLNFGNYSEKVIYVENPNVYSEKCLNSCKGKVLIYKEKPLNYLTKKNISFINKEDCLVEEFEEFILVDKNKLNNLINSSNLIENLIEDYKQERQNKAFKELLKNE
ncbi:DUF460 domain-containing protein [Candidatus Woesearchaeota archaeon]|nr:DUF460 domain-containing protein [Candidatus Woesearchaeota archaeon]